MKYLIKVIILTTSLFANEKIWSSHSAEIIEKLTEVKGIGRWTAEIYLMFSLGRADIFAAGDLALQEGCRIVYDLTDRPNEKVMREIASNWKPWRAVAARGLWAFYSYHKNREGIR